MLQRIISFFLTNRLFTALLLIGSIGLGISVAPFGWNTGFLPHQPIPVDAIPDLGENQQIVFTEWMGKSPQDIEDQITYPLTTYLLGIPGVKTVRSNSVFGFSSIYLIFEEDIEFYWSRSRILEKLSAIPPGLLPTGVQPVLGPDATALGQVFWYTIEGRDPEGNPTGGWDLHEIRSVQDYLVKYALSSTEDVAEVASVGGFVKEYQIDIRPEAMRAYDITLEQLIRAVQRSNRDTGAKTIELNQVEYIVRGLGTFETIRDIEEAVVRVHEFTPIRIRDVANVTLGPSARRGILDKDGKEVVGGVVVARYGSNPMQVIAQVKQQISELSPGLPSKVLENGVSSQLTIIPFYDRSGLIQETLGTLEEALTLEIIITILVVLVMLFHFRASMLIATLLPLGVLMTFGFMKFSGVDANIVALSGIAIAIGTMVDLGIVLTENILKKRSEASPEESLADIIRAGSFEVAPAIMTAVLTTVVSFLPVFLLEGAEGKLFIPLAYTKTFALVSALLIALIILPSMAFWMFRLDKYRAFVHALSLSINRAIFGGSPNQSLPFLTGSSGSSEFRVTLLKTGILLTVIWLLIRVWAPLGPTASFLGNLLFVVVLISLILGSFKLLELFYPRLLRWTLDHKSQFLTVPFFIIFMGALIWIGFPRLFKPVSETMRVVGVDLEQTSGWNTLSEVFPGLGSEFMPSLDEGSFLYMPTSMPHSGVEYNQSVLAYLDRQLAAIPEVELAVGKAGRAESALDPAPLSMFEHVIQYKSEFVTDKKGHPTRFKVDSEGNYLLKSGLALSKEEIREAGLSSSELIPDSKGSYFRNWRDHISSPEDIWEEIRKAASVPGVTSAPKLQPIETRLVMLQTGMRAPMGIKVFGPDLNSIEETALRLEEVLKEVPSLRPETVFAERTAGKPYIELELKREEMARYGLQAEDVLRYIDIVIGGMKVSETIEGRERYPIRIRYPRELRTDPEDLERITITAASGMETPLSEVVDFRYVKGPQAIKSEDTFLVGYVLFDKQQEVSEGDAVNDAERVLQEALSTGALVLPAGVRIAFSGNYENLVRAEKRLRLIIPVSIAIIFLILYLQFKSVSTSLMVFGGILIAFSGGFMLLWFYGQPWVAEAVLAGVHLGDVFNLEPIYLSVAVWVGFLALFGIATDDGVLMATYLDQRFKDDPPVTIAQIRQAVIEGGQRRIRPALMTIATTMIALLPVLTSSGRGSDIMIPMAIPIFGGMTIGIITVFIVPVLYCLREERKTNQRKGETHA